ncbi:MAG: hypothetical protein AB8B85_21555 [Paracoccaceae bacterium]
MTVPSALGPAIAALIAFAASAAFLNQAQLPELFSWSTVLLPAALTFALALGVAMLLPERLYFTRAERMRIDLYTATGLKGAMSERLLARAEQARGLAGKLRAAAPDMREDAAAVTIAAAEDLEGLAERILAEPANAQPASTLVTRARLVVDAVENFVDYKRDTGARDAEVDAARARIMESLAQMSEAADAVHTRLAQRRLTDMEVAADVAKDLLGRR